jgi:hypothetical protein
MVYSGINLVEIVRQTVPSCCNAEQIVLEGQLPYFCALKSTIHESSTGKEEET